MFRPVESSVRFPEVEAKVLEFWKQRKIYEKSLAWRSGAPRFVFYEGPPTANGLPHPGHCLTRAIKDLFPRYRTMRGYLCERKAGWDTHGLPVEVEVSKDLGIHSKEEIERYGVEPFIHECLQSVFRYTQQWERLTERIGFWIDMRDAYVTYHQGYIESVWWALKNLFDRGLLYQGYKIVWWWAQGGTALSSGEVGQGYREVADPSVFVKFPVVIDEMVVDGRFKQLGLDKTTSLLVWTTTPWTLPGNQFAAVSPTTDYSLVRDDENSNLILASSLLETIGNKAGRTFQVIKEFKGCDLIDLRYKPPFDGYYEMSRLVGDLRATSSGLDTRRMYWKCDCGFSDEKAERRILQTYEYLYWRVVPGSFVTTDAGTGIVHIAPAFGETDFEVLMRQRDLFAEDETLELFCPVNPDGTFRAEATELCHGRWVKDCDKDIARELKRRGLLYHQEQYLHEYPFCWRAEEDPLIQYPRKSWFIRTTQYKDAMLANNRQINWLPEHIQEGRFGNFLETNVDWALSRERYWGTPLPIWVCDRTGQAEAIASYAELLAKPGIRGTEVWEHAKQARPDLSEHLKVHKPYIDAVTYRSPFDPQGVMRRVPEVIDGWFDSGAMPFAQWGYPHQGRENFFEQFPADFISEAIDQTRGWFYSQLAISTLLFADPHSNDPDRPLKPFPHPFRNCIVLGLMLGEDGLKMSKSRRNYREPDEIFDRYGADALRWYFFANQPPWTSIRYNEQAIKDSIPEFLLRLWNVYSFLVIYANIDGFDPAALLAEGRTTAGSAGMGPPREAVASLSSDQLQPEALAAARHYRPLAQRGELDRWIISELERTTAAVIERMDAYDNFAACQSLAQFVDALSNWYVRRSRDRFWSGEKSADKYDAYWTLYECLITTCKLIAPFTPFLAEALWQNLAVAACGGSVAESVHLCDYPRPRPQWVDLELSQQMALVREIVSLGRSARMGAKLKVRQPLSKVEVILADRGRQAWLQQHADLIADELNVKQVEFAPRAEQYISYTVLPDLKRLGPRLGKQLPLVRKALAEVDAGRLLAALESAGRVDLDTDGGSVSLDKEDIQVRLQAKPGWTAAQGPNCVVVLATELDDELVAEGWVRDLVHAIQTQRKEMNLEYTDRIELGLETADDRLRAAIQRFAGYINKETLATKLDFVSLAKSKTDVDGGPISVKLGDAAVAVLVKKAVTKALT